MRSTKSIRRIRKSEPEQPADAPSGSVLELWEQGVGRHEYCAAALARLMMAEPDRVSTFADPAVVESALRAALQQELDGAKTSSAAFWLSAIAQFLDLKGRINEAADVYREALDPLKKSRGADHDETHAIAYELDRFLRRLGREKEASSIGFELRVEPLLGRNDEASLLALRGAAYDAFAIGGYAEAEGIYRHLLARNFEPAGTHCHLARVLLASGREAEATAEVNSAWEKRSEDDPYIIARILFLKALLDTLAGQDAQSSLNALKELLMNNPGARHTWLIAPVLDRVQERLTPQSQAFFSQMARALSFDSTD